MKRLLIVVALAALTACTPAQHQAWLDWHRQDSSAAEAYARQGCPGTSGCAVETSGSFRPGDCDSYVPLFRQYGLPSSTFRYIAWRESGCNHTIFVNNRTDLGGGLLGINLKGSLGPTWYAWCGATTGNITNAIVNVRCAAAAYRRMGLAPWR